MGDSSRAFAFSLAWLLALEPGFLVVLPGSGRGEARSQTVARPRRFTFKIDPRTPHKDLLPTPPDAAPAPFPWLVKDLTEVPEVSFQKFEKAREGTLPGDFHDLPEKERDKIIKLAREQNDKALERTALAIAQINHLNKEGTDQFLKVLLRSRPDLAGLPWVMGDACRTGKEPSQAFLREVNLLREVLLDLSVPLGPVDKVVRPVVVEKIWEKYRIHLLDLHKVEAETMAKGADVLPRRIAALMQMLSVHSQDMSEGLVDFLDPIDHPDAGRALAQLAVFSEEKELRDRALAALKKRPAEQYRPVLLEGLRYPWPQVGYNASAALIALERKEMVPQLIPLLDEPDPRAPRLKDGKYQVREVVKLNHLKNCLLCHAPGNTEDVGLDDFGHTENLVTAPVPSPGQPTPGPSGGYGRSFSPDILVRVDVNYLRQDFSRMYPVKDAAPWPEEQRFDFLVRTREITPAEAASYQTWVKAQGPDYLSPYQRAALNALRALTGREASEPTGAAWKKLLGR